MIKRQDQVSMMIIQVFLMIQHIIVLRKHLDLSYLNQHHHLQLDQVLLDNQVSIISHHLLVIKLIGH